MSTSPLSPAPYRYATTSVGLVVVRRGDDVNIMAAEWSYFVARDPLHIAVCLMDGSMTRELIDTVGEFTVTLCSESQASLANFVGSFSGRDIDKTSSDPIRLIASDHGSTPRVSGGVFSGECEVVAAVDLPGYRLVIGRVEVGHFDECANAHPLVKHGGMWALGDRLEAREIIAAAQFIQGSRPVVRVAATALTWAESNDPWLVMLISPGGERWLLGERSPCRGRVLADFPLARSIEPTKDFRVRVTGNGAQPGWARLSVRSEPAPGSNGSQAQPGVRVPKRSRPFVMPCGSDPIAKGGGMA